MVKRTLLYYIYKYPIAEKGLLIWNEAFSKHEFSNFNDIKSIFGNASIVGNNRVIFNSKGNDFQLIVSVNFMHQAGYVIWFGTHTEYDKIDAVNVAIDKNMQHFKID